jgi:hypothetical protein
MCVTYAKHTYGLSDKDIDQLTDVVFKDNPHYSSACARRAVACRAALCHATAATEALALRGLAPSSSCVCVCACVCVTPHPTTHVQARLPCDCTWCTS